MTDHAKTEHGQSLREAATALRSCDPGSDPLALAVVAQTFATIAIVEELQRIAVSLSMIARKLA